MTRFEPTFRFSLSKLYFFKELRIFDCRQIINLLTLTRSKMRSLNDIRSIESLIGSIFPNIIK